VLSDLVRGLFAKYAARMLRFKRKECRELVPVGDFHAAKMQEINKIIKELWTATYQGTGTYCNFSLL
jgi:hypothetical protein